MAKQQQETKEKQPTVDEKCIVFISTPEFLQSTEDHLIRLLAIANVAQNMTTVEAAYIKAVYHKGVTELLKLMEQRCKHGFFKYQNKLCDSCKTPQQMLCGKQEESGSVLVPS